MALALPVPAVAQGGEGSGLAQVMTFKVEPDDYFTFQAAVEKIAQAAQEANLSRDYAWLFWSDMLNFTLVYPVKSMAYFDDPDQWVRQFQGTDGEKTLNEAFQAMMSIDDRIVSNEVIEHVRESSYPAPDGVQQLAWAEVGEYWIKSGKEEEFDALTGEFLAFLKRIGYRYEISANRVRLGDVGRRLFVTFYDDRSNFFGPNSIESLMAEKGGAEEWQDIVTRFMDLITDAKVTHLAYRPEMSYWPMP
ncbi:MAG: hypothetical protein GTN62_09770 [Gemmatimonadales bacterium]|nr:hypothetical protein [Gemmatimonadales bacterium]NIN11832.1 hypothetical protein [Gemmatimonadales bacterium]NIN50382.1 hypothetical protein [Gemmatimonadales bacterium]NIP07846.1 hypothetical protein [Gemmatimonadales bacterium]NIR02051.1 hypothetical protein [Gemmatimonadales bacterium]